MHLQYCFFFPLEIYSFPLHISLRHQGSADNGGHIRWRVRSPIHFAACLHREDAHSDDEGAYSVRERLKDILRQYELRERHFECVIRSKELEVLLSRARAAEQKQLAEGEKARAEKFEEEARSPNIALFKNLTKPLPLLPPLARTRCFFYSFFFFFSQNQQLRKELDDAQKGQTMLVERLISCCKEVRSLFTNPTKPPCLPPTTSPLRCELRRPEFDRDRTLAAQRRAHATPIRFASRRAGEERGQSLKSGRSGRGGEWGKLTMTLIGCRRRQYHCILTAHTHCPIFFSLLVRSWINVRTGKQNTVHIRAGNQRGKKKASVPQ